MINDYGKQYHKDKVMDKTGFREKARLHQSRFRTENVSKFYNNYGNMLCERDAAAGFNFYREEFEILDAVKDVSKKYSEKLFANMLRSEHIPFNFFIPLERDKKFARILLNQFCNNTISEIRKIHIEHAPKEARKLLNDRTSFDTYIEYTHVDGGKGIFGIEVKYTEHGYEIGKKESELISKEDSPYNKLTRESNIYKSDRIEELKIDSLRQIWRNQLLAEACLRAPNLGIKHATLITFFPKGNSYYQNACKRYSACFEHSSQSKFVAITYESFIKKAKSIASEERFIKWLNYLEERYIIKGNYDF